MMNDNLFSTIPQMIHDGLLSPLLEDKVATGIHFSLKEGSAVGYEAYVFVFVEDGKAEAEINYVPCSLAHGSLLMLKPYMIVTAFRHDEAFRARYLFINRIFFASIPESMRYHAMQNKIISIFKVPDTQLNDAEYEEMADTMKSVCGFIPQHTLNRPMMLYRLSYMLLIATTAMQREVDKTVLPTSHKDMQFQDFLQLLCTNYIQHHDIGFYAQELCVSPRYLQRVVKEVSGRTVYSFISERLFIHARRLLVSSDMTVEQIAIALHFSSLSAFGKFFKTNSGISPKQFREQNKNR